jgi:acetyltransferase-like isoleucine patch superfamily enzyme
MSDVIPSGARTVVAHHGLRTVEPDPPGEVELADHLRATHGIDGLTILYGQFSHGLGAFDDMMRRVLVRALARRVGNGLTVRAGANFRHLETVEIGDGVFIGEQACLHGRVDGVCRIGNGAWIGPQVFLDARDLTIEDYVGIGPGARVIGSTHVALPVTLPVIQTDLYIEPVRIGAGSDIGANAVILPGVTIGCGAIVGAGAVVTKDVPEYAVVAGVPAKMLRSRKRD